MAGLIDMNKGQKAVNHKLFLVGGYHIDVYDQAGTPGIDNAAVEAQNAAFFLQGG